MSHSAKTFRILRILRDLAGIVIAIAKRRQEAERAGCPRTADRMSALQEGRFFYANGSRNQD